MPLYEYICIECSRKFEELIFSSDANVICPACGSDKTTKQFSTFASNAIKSDAKCSTCKPKQGFS